MTAEAIREIFRLAQTDDDFLARLLSIQVSREELERQQPDLSLLDIFEIVKAFEVEENADVSDKHPVLVAAGKIFHHLETHYGVTNLEDWLLKY